MRGIFCLVSFSNFSVFLPRLKKFNNRIVSIAYKVVFLPIKFLSCKDQFLQTTVQKTEARDTQIYFSQTVKHSRG